MLLSLAAAYFVVLAKPVRMPARKNSFWRGFSRAGNWFYFLKRGCLHSVVASWLSRAGVGSHFGQEVCRLSFSFNKPNL